jgi:hypothetical protein
LLFLSFSPSLPLSSPSLLSFSTLSSLLSPLSSLLSPLSSLGVGKLERKNKEGELERRGEREKWESWRGRGEGVGERRGRERELERERREEREKREGGEREERGRREGGEREERERRRWESGDSVITKMGTHSVEEGERQKYNHINFRTTNEEGMAKQ